MSRYSWLTVTQAENMRTVKSSKTPKKRSLNIYQNNPKFSKITHPEHRLAVVAVNKADFDRNNQIESGFQST
ncbi:MAG: hypothetical protein V7K69_16675 [Nostoc sp.]|uniref:hypothetical protein n=1 Tax=Nostoc sp. TaxID=1180 RepID=UPI002FFAF63D